MALPDEGPCEPWVTWEQVAGTEENPSCCGADLASITDTTHQTLILETATEVLWALSGHKYPGLCTATRSFCIPSRACGGCLGGCRCGPDARIDLGRRFAVSSVDEVLVDGVPLLEGTDYRVDDWRFLVRLDGSVWSNADVTDPEALEVTWTYGRAVPTGGVNAAAILACEIGAACVPGATCHLPARVTGVTAEGVTYTLVDPQRIIEKGATGLYLVDLWLHSVTKAAVPEAGGIFDPGACGRAVATDTGSGAS